MPVLGVLVLHLAGARRETPTADPRIADSRLAARGGRLPNVG